MTEREKAIQRLRVAAQRLSRATEEMDAAEHELTAAALALDELERHAGETAPVEKEG